MLLLDYTRERLNRGAVAAAVLVTAAGAQIGRGTSDVLMAAADLGIALCLVIAFRIWDDVMDRARDRARHPERVLVGARSVTSAIVASLCLAGTAATAVVALRGAASLMVLIAYAVLLAVWYSTRGPRSAGGDRMLLSKYPVFTLALIGPTAFAPRPIASAAGVYAAACLYEWLHDRESPVFSTGGLR